MSYQSTIEWTDATWNPVRGCVKISPGCKHCYAEVFAERWRGVPGHPYEFGFDLRLIPEKLLEPLSWSRPRKVFVNSMSDLFQSGVPEAYILKSFAVMRAADWHTYQILTKRPEQMRRLLTSSVPTIQPLNHIWIGVSVEDRKHGIPRIEQLQKTPAAVRFLSIEPLLEDLGKIDLDGIHWVIVGGESGYDSRPIKESWINSILRQCRAADVPFFFKQWGGVQKKKAGRSLNGKLYNEYPSFQLRPVPSHAERLEGAKIIRDQFADWQHVA